MIFTRKDLAQKMGLKPGDQIKVWNTIFKLNDKYSFIGNNDYPASPALFIDEEFEIIQPKKKIGDLICKDVDCDTCPLRVLHCDAAYSDTLYKILERHFAEMGIKDKEIYNILKERLDKEVIVKN